MSTVWKYLIYVTLRADKQWHKTSVERLKDKIAEKEADRTFGDVQIQVF